MTNNFSFGKITKNVPPEGFDLPTGKYTLEKIFTYIYIVISPYLHIKVL